MAPAAANRVIGADGKEPAPLVEAAAAGVVSGAAAFDGDLNISARRGCGFLEKPARRPPGTQKGLEEWTTAAAPAAVVVSVAVVCCSVAVGLLGLCLLFAADDGGAVVAPPPPTAAAVASLPFAAIRIAAACAADLVNGPGEADELGEPFIGVSWIVK